MIYKIAALVPTYNHYKDIKNVVQRLLDFGLDILIVDDGSDLATQKTIEHILREYPKIMHIRFDKNEGKGVAVCKGFFYLLENGFSHAFQIDADGQHDLSVLSDFIHTSKNNPCALISGNPVYDHCAPMGRKIGRWFTHIWVFIETLSFKITDSMCGFRIYPLEKTLGLLKKKSVGKRMDFDTDIIVRLFWDGVPTVMLPVKVIYPDHNISNFQVLKDNWRITKMHTRLFFQMIFNIRSILKNRPNYHLLNLSNTSVSWSSIQERGHFFGMYFIAVIYRLLGKRICQSISFPIVLYYFLRGKEQRKASYQFLEKTLKRPVRLQDQLQHFMHFFDMALDKFSAWIGASSNKDICEKSMHALNDMMLVQGGVLLVSHLGNMEFCRAITDKKYQKRLHILLHTKNSKRFNQLLRYFNPDVQFNIYEVTEMGPDTIIHLKKCVESGDFVIIAADRFPVMGDKRVCYVSFLGEDAPFSQGPYILASLLECPVYTVMAVKNKDQYKVDIHLFAEKITLDRPKRQEQLFFYCQKYAYYLEEYAKKYPFQWYNFFNFWKKL
ncbi:MAG: hypothetical protein CNLJKLNK_00516 [Holosporales bacterium]